MAQSSSSASEVVNTSFPLHKMNTAENNHDGIDGFSSLGPLYRVNSAASLSIQDYSSSSMSEDTTSNHHRPSLVPRRSSPQSFDADTRGSGESSTAYPRQIDDKGGATTTRRASPPRGVITESVHDGVLPPAPTVTSSSPPSHSHQLYTQKLPPLPRGRSSTPPPSLRKKQQQHVPRSRSQSRLYSSGNHIMTPNSYSSPIQSTKISNIPSPIQSPSISSIPSLMPSLPGLWSSEASTPKRQLLPTRQQQQQQQYPEDDGESSVSSDCSNTSLDRLEKLSKHIRSQIRAAEMAALVLEAEEAAALGKERFSAHPSTYGIDSEDEEGNHDNSDDRSRGSVRSLPPQVSPTTTTAVMPFKLVRTSTIDNSSTRSSFRSLTKIRSRLLNQDVTPQVKVSKLRNINEVVPKFTKLHGHLRTHMVLGGVQEHTLSIDPSPKFEDVVRSAKSTGSKAPSVTSSVGHTVTLLKNLTIFGKKTAATIPSSSSASPESPRKKLRLDKHEEQSVLESPQITQSSRKHLPTNGLSPNSILANGSYDYSDDDDDDDDDGESLDSSRMGSILADHLVPAPRRGTRKPPSPIKIPSGLHLPDIQYDELGTPLSPPMEHRKSPTKMLLDSPKLEQSQQPHDDDTPIEVVTTPLSAEPLLRTIGDFHATNSIGMESKDVSASENGVDKSRNAQTLTRESDDTDTQEHDSNHFQLESPDAPSSSLEFNTPCRLRGIRRESKGNIADIQPTISMPDLSSTSSQKGTTRKRTSPHQTLKQRSTFETAELRPSLFLSAVDLTSGQNKVKLTSIKKADSSTSGETTESSSCKPEMADIEEMNSMPESDQDKTQDTVDKDPSNDESENKLEEKGNARIISMNETQEEQFTPIITSFENRAAQVDIKNDIHATCEEEKKCEEEDNVSEDVERLQMNSQALNSKDAKDDGIESETEFYTIDKQAVDDAPLNKLEPIRMDNYSSKHSDAQEIMENIDSGDIEPSNSCAECLLCDVPQMDETGISENENEIAEKSSPLRRSSSLPSLSIATEQQQPHRPKEEDYESKTDIGAPSFQTPRSSSSVLTAMNLFKQSISPHSSSPADTKASMKGDSVRNRAITPRQNNAFLQNYLYCSKRHEIVQEEKNVANTQLNPFCEPVAGVCAEVVLCGGYKDAYYDDIPQKKKGEARKLDLDGPKSPTTEPEAWFDTAVDRFDDMLANVIGEGEEHKSRWTLENFYSPKLKFKKDRKRIPTANEFDSIEEQSRLLTAEQFHMLYGITREEYLGLPKEERAKVKGKRAVVFSRGGFPVDE